MSNKSKKQKSIICALMLGRAGSITLPGKNILPILGKKLCEYPLIAASKSKYIERIFVSTDCPIVSKISKKYNASIIKRPAKLATHTALGEDVFRHGYFKIKKILKAENKKIELMVLLFANAPTINCDRDSQGNVHYADMSVSVVRPHCLEKIEEGLLPQKWMGKIIAPIHSWGGCDVDMIGKFL